MTRGPYRVIERPPAPETPGIEERLGVVRSVHARPPLWRGLLPAIGCAVLVVALILSLTPRDGALLLCAPFASIVFALFAWSPLRMRGTVVRLHANGVAVFRRGSVDRVLFDDVDELWYELDVSTVTVVRLARVHALRLVDHDGGEHRVPLTVTDPLPLLSWATRSCSDRLLPEARRAFRAGEPLTFGGIRIGRDGVTIGRQTLGWEELRLVRFQPDRILFFRRQTFFTWRIVSLDRVPHPSVFAKLVEENAPRVDTDYPFRVG